jgi:hypothetical protein
MTSNNGSEWRIWDLHVHTPATYGGRFEDFIKNASNSIPAVLGLNDYCTLSGYEQILNLGGIPNKVCFPVVEFRMHTLLHTKLKPTGVRINFHVIFSNDETVFPTISTWLKSLKCYNEKGDTIQLGVAADLSRLTFDFDKVVDSLKEFKLYGEHALVWLPYDEYGGIDEIDPVSDGYFKLSLINRAHIMGSSTKKQIDFFTWNDEKFSQEEYKKWFDRPKPSIKGSDAHKIDYPFGQLQNQLSQPIDKYCWINADRTFKGLKQIVVEPSRVFIGDEPSLSKRVRNNPTKFIKQLSIGKNDGVTIPDVWFDSLKISLNKGLVAIIGNKGGGKSAITDIIGLCGNTHQEPGNFSFLTNQKFRKQKPLNLAEKFHATLTWEDGISVTKGLNDNPVRTQAERVRYIPQNFLERLCSNIESDDFERELKSIIFSHTPFEKRLNKSSLDELIDYKSSLLNEQITQIQGEITRINKEVSSLELQTKEEYLKEIEDKVSLKKRELEAHNAAKPVKPEETKSDVDPKRLQEIQVLREQIEKQEIAVNELRTSRHLLSIELADLSKVFQYFSNLEQQLTKVLSAENEYNLILKRFQLSITEVFQFSIKRDLVKKVLDKIQEQVNAIDADLNLKNDSSKVTKLDSDRSSLSILQDELDKPAQKQQRYLDDTRKWEKQKLSIEGAANEEGSLKFYEEIVRKIKVDLPDALKEIYKKRKSLVEELFDKKVQQIEIRKELFEPVSNFIDSYKELKKKYDVKIDVMLELRSFQDEFFSYVNQSKSGSFQGKEDGFKKVQDLIERANFNSKEGFIAFLKSILLHLKSDRRDPDNIVKTDIDTQLKKGSAVNELYDFLFHGNYLQPIYNLKLGAKTLLELSPGERGALLLIFYLILDKDDIPLLIDQPEENLDNESVYYILVHFIKKVKENRQIIIVTHNPNLAVVCDADQLIHMFIEKDNRNTVKFYAASIEDPEMNRRILNILEGTLYAFENRDLKYTRL